MPEFEACFDCGELHLLDEIELTFRRPDAIVALSEEEREQSAKESEDICAIWGSDAEGHRYFIRGLLPLKVIARLEPYNIGVWIEVSELDFHKIYELWDAETQSIEPPFKGMLANEIPTKPESLGLRGYLQLTGPKTRPKFMLDVSKATLFIEQQNGISAHQAAGLTKLLSP